MATTTTEFEALLLAQHPQPGSRVRGLQAGAAYKLRQAYLRGFGDPMAHELAKSHPDQLAALEAEGNLAEFDAITGP